MNHISKAVRTVGLMIAGVMLAACSLRSAPPANPTPAIETQTPLATASLRPVIMEDVRVTIGAGSPNAVDVSVNGLWNDPCAQLAQIEQRLEGNRFEISLMASPARSNCPSDAVGLPFRIAVPLNMVEMPAGSYIVAVNGVETSFEWRGVAAGPAGTEAPQGVGLTFPVAYIGRDGNVWVKEIGNGEARQLTNDANASLAADVPGVSYSFLNISSDGRMVAYRRDKGTPVTDGMQYEIGLWVYNLDTDESKLVYDKTPAGFDWKPGTHLLAFGQEVQEGYFTARGQTAAELATGVLGIDLDSGDSAELVKPERGYALYGPVWSPDGRFLSFEEVIYMEGRGNFAYYDFEAQQYIPWEKAIGMYDWSPDSSYLAFDYMTYTATGNERVYLRSREGTEETQLSPETPGYAYYPAISPKGDIVAYLSASGGVDSPMYILTVQAIQGGESRELGLFETVSGLDWSPDGKYLVFSAGPYEAQKVYAVSVADGNLRVLAEGGQPSLPTP